MADIFLSRLCGGEQQQPKMADSVEFLSRLCGGERGTPRQTSDRGFLSRLCGGEHRSAMGDEFALFLSRLCGGELGQFSANLLYFQAVKERIWICPFFKRYC